MSMITVFAARFPTGTTIVDPNADGGEGPVEVT
jgi:hypothetical protein